MVNKKVSLAPGGPAGRLPKGAPQGYKKDSRALEMNPAPGSFMCESERIHVQELDLAVFSAGFQIQPSNLLLREQRVLRQSLRAARARHSPVTGQRI